MTTNEHTERAEFERWARAQPWIKDLQRYEESHPKWPGQYGHCDTERAWNTWQASRAALLETQRPELKPLTDDTRRLDFVLSNAAFIVSTERDGIGKCFQLWSQDEDENYITLSGEGAFFPNERAAIDVAMEAAHGIKEKQ